MPGNIGYPVRNRGLGKKGSISLVKSKASEFTSVVLIYDERTSILTVVLQRGALRAEDTEDNTALRSLAIGSDDL